MQENKPLKNVCINKYLYIYIHLQSEWSWSHICIQYIIWCIVMYDFVSAPVLLSVVKRSMCHHLSCSLWRVFQVQCVVDVANYGLKPNLSREMDWNTTHDLWPWKFCLAVEKNTTNKGFVATGHVWDATARVSKIKPGSHLKKTKSSFQYLPTLNFQVLNYRGWEMMSFFLHP